MSWYAERVATASLNAELGRLKELGVSISHTPAKLDPPKNAMTYYDEAARTLGGAVPKFPAKPNPAEYMAMSIYLSKQEHALAQIRRGAACDDYEAGEDWIGEQRASMDKVRSRSALPQLSLLKARMMSHEGHAAEAVDWLLTSEIVAYQTRGRSLLGALHHCIADTAALGELRNEMLVHSHEPKFWDAVDRFNANLPPAMDLKGTLGSAVETARAALRDYKQMDVNSPSFADRYREYMLRLPSVKRTVEATLVMRYRELAEALPQAGQGWAAAMKETARIDAEIQADNSTTGHYVGLMMPRFQGASRDAGEVRQQRNEILALCDVYEVRLLTGKFPSRLPSPIPRDAFSGKPLTYHIENGVPIVGPTR